MQDALPGWMQSPTLSAERFCANLFDVTCNSIGRVTTISMEGRTHCLLPWELTFEVNVISQESVNQCNSHL